MVMKSVDLAARYWQQRPAAKTDKSFNELLIPLVSKSLKAFILIMAVLVTLDNMQFNIKTLLAGVSVSGLALGLAAQDTVANLFGAAAVFIDKPFKIGDRVQLNGVDGTVEEIGLRSTRIRHLDGYLITVPNKTMGNSTITNVTRRPNIKTVLNLGITYDTPAQKINDAVKIVREVYQSHPMTQNLHVGFNNFSENSLNILVVHFWKDFDFDAYLAGMQKLHIQVKDRFDQAGIAFAFPSRTVYLRQDNDWKVHLPGSEQRAA
jgi:MscS family membrane protein